MRVLAWIYREWRPPEGWLIFSLVALFALQVPLAVTAGEWVPEVNILWPTTIVGFVVTYLLIRLGTKQILGWFLILANLLLVSFLYFVPIPLLPLFMLRFDTFQSTMRRDWSLFVSRAGGWFGAVGSGSVSRETLLFALFLGVLSGLVVSLYLWTLYRRRQPLGAATILLLGLALNRFYTGEALNQLFIGVLLTPILISIWRHRERVLIWDRDGVDYFEELSFNVLGIAFAASLVVALLAFSFPRLPYSAIAAAFRNSRVNLALEARLEEMFAGVQVAGGTASAGNRSFDDSGTIGPGGAGSGVAGSGAAGGSAGNGRGAFPRAYLVGHPPELAERIVFEAEISSIPANGADFHWQATSYDRYTGFGWARSESGVRRFDSAETLADQFPYTDTTGTARIEIKQTVRFSDEGGGQQLPLIGRPESVDQPIVLRTRGEQPNPDEIVGIESAFLFELYAFQAVGSTVVLDPALLNRTDYERLDPTEVDYIEPYLALPDNITQRTVSLAQEITQGATGPYAQAQALERFLRQYQYDLDIEPVPDGVEPVDYFLFDLQRGYCDLYATSMVVMARSLGLPARLGVGYQVPPPTEDGRLLVRQTDGHSWAEIYFPGTGWVEFEPTAGFAVNPDVGSSGDTGSLGDDALQDVLAIPDEGPTFDPFWVGRRWVRILFVTLLLLLPGGIFVALRWFRQPQTVSDLLNVTIEMAVEIGYTHSAADTPRQFNEALSYYLLADSGKRLMRYRKRFGEIVGGVVELHQRHIYGGARSFAEVERVDRARWRELRFAYFVLYSARIMQRK